MTRRYVTVNGGGDATWLSANAGNTIQNHALANLRGLRIASGFDYLGFNVVGEFVNQAPGLDLGGLERRIRVVRGVQAASSVDDVRVVVSRAPIGDPGVATGFGLLLAIHEGEQFSWGAGSSNIAGIVTVDKADRSAKVNAVVQDLFQDVMLANCSSIQSVIGKYLASGGTRTAFYAEKAAYARHQVSANSGGCLFDNYSPDRYATFSSIARKDLLCSMDRDERARLIDLWSSFLTRRFSSHLLTVDEAVRLVRVGGFRGTNQERVGKSGERPPSRSRREYLSEDEVADALTANQTVVSPGSYILCVQNRRAGKEVGSINAAFGLRSSKRSRRLVLCTEASYRDRKMIDHVRKGVVTPIRLFLQAQR